MFLCLFGVCSFLVASVALMIPYPEKALSGASPLQKELAKVLAPYNILLIFVGECPRNPT